MPDYRQGTVKQVTVEIEGTRTTYDMSQPIVLDGRTITQISLGTNVGTQIPVIVFFAEQDAAGNHNEHIVARMSPDSGMPHLIFNPPPVAS